MTRRRPPGDARPPDPDAQGARSSDRAPVFLAIAPASAAPAGPAPARLRSARCGGCVPRRQCARACPVSPAARWPGRGALMRASMTRHSPASLMKPVLETLISQSGLRTSRLVLRKVCVRLLISTSYSVSVSSGGSAVAAMRARSRRARSCGEDTLSLDRPVGSMKRVLVMPSACALAFSGHESRRAARGRRPSALARAVLGRHQRQVQHVAAAQLVPTRRREVVCLRPSMPSSVISSISFMGWLASTTTTAVISFEAIGRTTFFVLGEQHGGGFQVLHVGGAGAQCGGFGAPTMPAAAWRPRMRRPPPGHGRVCWACRSCHPCRPCRRRWPGRAFLRHGGGFAALGRGGGFLPAGCLGAAACLAGALPEACLRGGPLPAACLGRRLPAACFGDARLPAAGLPAAALPAPDLADGRGLSLACCALQAADLALVLQGSEFFAACAAGRSAHIASAIRRYRVRNCTCQVNAMVSAGLSVCIEMFRTSFVGTSKSPDELEAYASNLNSNFK